jgi:hypothetical protein
MSSIPTLLLLPRIELDASTMCLAKSIPGGNKPCPEKRRALWMDASLQHSVMISTQKISLIVPADPIRSIRGTKFVLCRPDDKVRHYHLANDYL